MATLKTIFLPIISFLLICIFAFSITPVIVIHNLLANHTDRKIEHHHTKSNEIANAGINCNTENFVAERNFIISYSPIRFTHFKPFQVFADNNNQTFYSRHHFYAELRGPPAESVFVF